MKKVRHTKRSTTVIFTEKKRRKFKQPYKDRLYRRKWNKTPRGRYTEQRKRAISRGIEWQFTFESWWQLWQESGHWEERGKKSRLLRDGSPGRRGPVQSGQLRNRSTRSERAGLGPDGWHHPPGARAGSVAFC